MASGPKILLTGATGYVGGRLLRALEDKDLPLRCMVRRPEFLKPRAGPNSEVTYGNVLRKETISQALQGIDTAYFLVHSMGSSSSFEHADRLAAENFGEAAREAGVRRIVYLGGLGSGDDTLSPHLKSRHEVGEVLRASGVPVVEFRASIILGSGSLSFEIIRALVERLPIMIAPRWVSTLAQPIAIEDVVSYLAEAILLPHGDSSVFEIGGADRVSYGQIIEEYARQRGLRRLIIPVPVLTPRLSSLWLTLVSPVHAKVGRLLIDGLRNPTLVSDDSARSEFSVIPMGIREATERALAYEDREFAETRWSDAISSGPKARSWGGQRFGSRLVDSRTAVVSAPPEDAFRPIRRIGGASGWYYANWLWRLRGVVDSFFGGVGHRRGRRNPDTLQVGDTLDLWRVEAFEPDRRLRLAAEMKLPGRAWLEFEVTEQGEQSIIRQTAIFYPIGLLGIAYWYSLYPVHQFIFAGMLRSIATAGGATPHH